MPGTAPQTFLSLCLALCLCSACDDPVARRLSSRVLAVEGQAQRLTADGATPLNPESWIVPEEKILIAPGGRVDLMILPGIWAELDGGSELELVALLLERNGDDWIHPMRKRQATVRLVQGSIYIALQQSQTRSRLIIHTPVGTVFAARVRNQARGRPLRGQRRRLFKRPKRQPRNDCGERLCRRNSTCSF